MFTVYHSAAPSAKQIQWRTSQQPFDGQWSDIWTQPVGEMPKNASEDPVLWGAKLSSAQFLPFQRPHWAQTETPESPGGGHWLSNTCLSSLFCFRQTFQTAWSAGWSECTFLDEDLDLEDPKLLSQGNPNDLPARRMGKRCHLWWRPRRPHGSLTRWRAWTTTIHHEHDCLQKSLVWRF